MSTVNKERVFLYNPADISEAVSFFEVCAKLKKNGRDISVLVDSSGYFTRIGNGELAVIKKSCEIEAFSEKGEIIIVLSPVNLERIMEISVSDMLAVVDGGVRVSEFNEAIRKEGLLFPTGTLLYNNITMAQLVDDGFVSCLESGFGGLREYILSIDIVTAAGEIISPGSHSVKDVTGYNITGFVYGAMGRCGLVTKIVTRLIPACEYSRIVTYGGKGRVLEKLSSIVNLEVGPVSQTIYYAESLALVCKKGKLNGGVIPPGKEGSPAKKRIPFNTGKTKAVLAVRLESGNEETLGSAEDIIEKIIISNGLEADKIIESELKERNIVGELFEAVEECAAAIHISFYHQGDLEPPVGGVVWKTLYPHRIHYLLPCRKDTKLSDLRKTAVSSFLDELEWDLSGLRVECIVIRDNSLEKLPVGDERLIEYVFSSKEMEDVKIADILKDVYVFFYGNSYREERESVFETVQPLNDKNAKVDKKSIHKLNSRLLRLFDPERIIIRK